MAAEFELYKDHKGEFRWRLQAENNKVIADSAEGFTTKANCEKNIADVRRLAPAVPLNDKA